MSTDTLILTIAWAVALGCGSVLIWRSIAFVGTALASCGLTAYIGALKGLQAAQDACWAVVFRVLGFFVRLERKA